MDRKWGIFSAIGGFVTLTFAVISTATPDWIHATTVPVSQGLWQFCQFGMCITLHQMQDYDEAIRSFMVISCITLALAVGASIVVALRNKPTALSQVIVVLFTISELCILIGMSIFTAKYWMGNNGAFAFGYSYHLGWTAFAASIIMSVGTGVARKYSS